MNFLSVLPLIVTLGGIYFLFKLRFFFLFHPLKTFKRAIGSLKKKGAFGSFTLALAGTLGIGNIVGVAVGISIGGAGAVFWLLVSSFFSMVLKYCETSLSSEIGNSKGMIGIIKASFGRASEGISLVYALLVLVLCFFMGAAFQSASVGEYAYAAFSFSTKYSALILILIVGFSIYIGGKKIEKITAIIIPLTTIIYISLCLITVIMHLDKLSSAFISVIGEAFDIESGVGGTVGFLTSSKIKEGYLRGILSNEAGAGTSTIAHSLNTSDDSASVGVLGMLEVVFDTVILCMLTAFCALVCLDDFCGMSGVSIIFTSVGSSLGPVSEYLLLLCIFAFAYSTVICWYYYGRFAYKYLFSGGRSWLFTLLFLFFVFLGCLVGTSLFIPLIDIVMLFLSLITIVSLIKNSDRIILLSERSGLM